MLKLYVKGSSSISQSAIENLSVICSSIPDEDIDFSIIDLDTNLKISEKDRILVVPTLIIISPLPARRIISGLSDRETVNSYLGLTENNIE